MNTTISAPSTTTRQRRSVIKLMGGGVVLAAAPLTAGCNFGVPNSALTAWESIDDGGDIRRFILAHGLLAPNPHNRQPWVADLSKPGEINLICDKNRLLPETDPYGRQILIGCGAFIEAAVLAAAERGYRVEVLPFPHGEPPADALPGDHLVARLILSRDSVTVPDPLFVQIRRRHTNRKAYDNRRQIPKDHLIRLLAVASIDSNLISGAVTDDSRRDGIRELTRVAYEVELTTTRTYLESARLFRIGPDAIAKHRDGISITGAMPRLLAAIGLFDPMEVPVLGSSNYTRVMERWAPFETGSGYFWFASRGNSRVAQLASGRAYMRAHLTATADGIDMHPLSQALQEFPEVRGLNQNVHRILGCDPDTTTVQMLARVGYSSVVDIASPRRDLDSLIKT